MNAMASPSAPRASSVGRIFSYLGVMFPLPVMIPYGIASYFAVELMLQALSGAGPLRIEVRSIVGAVSYVLFLLLMRVYDELKDVESDRRLAAAGDPRYMSRPIVTGHITVEDLVRMRWGLTALLVALHIPFALSWQGVAFALLMLIGWLALKWFFYPPISKSLLLALLTHNPIGLAGELYIVAVHVSAFGAGGLTVGKVALLLLAFWMPLTAWETSRKIRMPADETDYQTYSKLFGRAAPLVPAVCIGISLALLVPLARTADAGTVFLGALVAVGILVIAACLLFRVAPTPARARLQPLTELYGLVANVGLVIALAVHHGLRLG